MFGISGVSTGAKLSLDMVGLIVFSTFVLSALALPPPTYLKPCSVKENFDKCAFESGLAAIKSFIKGDKKYGIPTIDPFALSHIEISPGQSLKLVMDEVTAVGLEKAVLKGVAYSPEKKHFKIKLDVEALTLKGKYEINGQILVLPIQGKGPFEISVYGGNYDYDFDIELEERKGVTYGKIKNDDLEFKLTKAALKFENLFNGDKTLGPQMNKFLNDNWEDVFRDLRGAIKESFAAVCRTVLQNYFSRIPFKDLILE